MVSFVSVQQVGRDLRVAEQQRGADGERRLAAGEQLLALDVELRVEPVLLGVMLEARERREFARRIREHDRLRARLLREGHEDVAALFIRRILAALRATTTASFTGSRFSSSTVSMSPAGPVRWSSDHWPLRTSARLDFPPPMNSMTHAPRLPFSSGNLNVRAHAPERAAARGVGGEIVRDLAVRHEAVEREVGVELALVGEEIRERVDLVDFHDELRRVLDEKVERHVVGGREERRIRQREIDIDPVFQRLKSRRRKQRRPSAPARRRRP